MSSKQRENIFESEESSDDEVYKCVWNILTITMRYSIM